MSATIVISKITDAQSAADKFIRPYVERGDTYESIRAGHMGAASAEYRASIGGYIGDKQYDSHWIVVKEVNGETVNQVFRLREVYDKIATGQERML